MAVHEDFAGGVYICIGALGRIVEWKVWIAPAV